MEYGLTIDVWEIAGLWWTQPNSFIFFFFLGMENLKAHDFTMKACLYDEKRSKGEYADYVTFV